MKRATPPTPSTRTRSARPWGRRLLVFTLLLGCLWIVGGKLIRFVAAQPYFALQHIVVHTDGRLSQADIRRWSGSPRRYVGLRGRPPAGRNPASRPGPDPSGPGSNADCPTPFTSGSRRVVPSPLSKGRNSSILIGTAATFFDPELSTVRLDLPYVSGVADLWLDAPTARRALGGVLRLLAASRCGGSSCLKFAGSGTRAIPCSWPGDQITIRVGREPRPENLARVGRVLETWPGRWASGRV